MVEVEPKLLFQRTYFWFKEVRYQLDTFTDCNTIIIHLDKKMVAIGTTTFVDDEQPELRSTLMAGDATVYAYAAKLNLW
jgi:hypothetical protein